MGMSGIGGNGMPGLISPDGHTPVAEPQRPAAGEAARYPTPWGLVAMLHGKRKSMQPMAERLGLDHYQLQQFVSSSTWHWGKVRPCLLGRGLAPVHTRELGRHQEHRRPAPGRGDPAPPQPGGHPGW
ncbi:transposase [Streptomyces tubercidicus]|uniref:transposase n=1 Tax=Streptomyces tubercidicus TaxID=47759 RepID=UPI003676057E